MAKHKLIDAKGVTDRIGASGASRGANISTAQNNITQIDKRKRSVGTPGSGARSNRASIIKTGKTDVGTGVFGGIERAAVRGVEARRGRGPTGNLKANVDPVKELVGGTLRPREGLNPVVKSTVTALQPPITDGPISGGRKAPQVPGRATFREVSGEVEAREKRGEKRTGPGGFTDLGSFRRKNDGPTLTEEANAPGLFKTTREIIADNFKANKASAQERGVIASAKAVNARRKSLGDLFSSISETDPTNPILDTIKAELQASFSPAQEKSDIAGKILAIVPDIDRGTLRQLIALKGA